MDSLDKIAKNVVNLLWSGRPDEAHSFLASEVTRVENELYELNELLAGLRALMPNRGTQDAATPENVTSSVAAPESRPSATAIATRPPSQSMTAAESTERRNMVIDSALEVVRRDGRTIAVQKVAAALKAKNYDLRVADARASTTISKILASSEQFVRVAPGLVQYSGDNLFSDDQEQEV